MRFIVRIPELDCSLYGNEGSDNKNELFLLIRKLEASGKLVEGGLLADERGGFLLMENESFAENETLLASIFHSSRYTLESHPLLPFRNIDALLCRIQERDRRLVENPVPQKPKNRKKLQPAAV